MKSKIRLLALDLDGTALRSDNTLSKAVAEAIEHAGRSGIEVVAASGRPYASMPKEVLALRGIRYVIASNGAAVYDGGGKRIASSLLSGESVDEIMRLTEPYDLIWEAFRDGETCTDRRYYDDPVKYGCTQAYIDYVRGSRGCCDDMRGYIAAHRSKLDSIEFVCADAELRNKVRELLEKNLRNVYITSSSANFVEFMHSDATKSNAVKLICGLLGIDPKETAACGNADNDVDMIAQAGIGAAVANASKGCIAAAGIVVDTNDNDGVAELINKLLNHNYSALKNE